MDGRRWARVVYHSLRSGLNRWIDYFTRAAFTNYFLFELELETFLFWFDFFYLFRYSWTWIDSCLKYMEIIWNDTRYSMWGWISIAGDISIVLNPTLFKFDRRRRAHRSGGWHEASHHSMSLAIHFFLSSFVLLFLISRFVLRSFSLLLYSTFFSIPISPIEHSN